MYQNEMMGAVDPGMVIIRNQSSFDYVNLHFLEGQHCAEK